MNGSLRDPLLAALDAAATPVDFFIRDDDAGWDDPRLFALLTVTRRAGVPIDLAAIPTAVGGCLASELIALMDGTGLVGVHQHGHAHVDFEAPGRKCEFGAARPIAAQRRDLLDGRARLQGLFGARLERIFTPPWNRCGPRTPALLAGLGYTALSRDLTAPAQDALPELAVAVDWTRERRAAETRGEPVEAAVGRALARHAGYGVPVGLMLHHATMGDDELDRLQAALVRWTRHPNARWRRMNDLLAARRPAHPEPRLTEETT
jgi:hypothetical protein